jgi:hypothetical protein
MELENAISEELPMPEPPVVTAAATESDKMLAACIGAVLTSLTSACARPESEQGRALTSICP